MTKLKPFIARYYDPTELNSIFLSSIGFAQVGRWNAIEKFNVEKDVIFTTLDKNPIFSIPIEFKHAVRYTWQSHRHEFGTYYSLYLMYDSSIDDNVEKSDEHREQHDRFWDWAHSVEDYSFEEELYDICVQRYICMYPELAFDEGLTHDEVEDDDYDE